MRHTPCNLYGYHTFQGSFMQKSKLVLIAIAFLFFGSTAKPDTLNTFSVSRMNISGPRFGMTSPVGSGDFALTLQEHGISKAYSEFGWHFEYQVAPDGNTPSFVIEVVPLIGGLEYGLAIPSVTIPLGIRLQNGIEFGIGPNVVFGYPVISSSIVLALGKTFNYHGVGIPLNVAVASGKGGYAVSCLLGYAIIKSKETMDPIASAQ